MDTLTERTIRRLCERLEVLRLRGPIPALMAEAAVGVPTEEMPPLRGFADALPSGDLRQLPDSSQSCRKLWLAAAPAVVAEFRNFCRDAGEVAVPMLHAAGYGVGLGTANAASRWLWAVFELAELRLPGTCLRLDRNTVWRVNADGVEINEGMLDDSSPFAALAATASATRYWKLVDAVESSLAALDVVQTQKGSPPTHRAANPADRRRRSTRKIDVDHALGKLEAQMRRELVRDLGAESAALAALVEQLYSLSAEDLVPMLRRIGFKMSAKTIRRPGNSQKYKSWERYRSPIAPSTTDVDVGPAALSGVRPRAADVADDAVDSGNLSRRTGGRGITHIGKSASEKAAEDAADRFAREAGIDLPPAE